MYFASSFNPETVVVDVADHAIVARLKQESPFCPDIAATPDGKVYRQSDLVAHSGPRSWKDLLPA